MSEAAYINIDAAEGKARIDDEAMECVAGGYNWFEEFN